MATVLASRMGVRQVSLSAGAFRWSEASLVLSSRAADGGAILCPSREGSGGQVLKSLPRREVSSDAVSWHGIDSVRLEVRSTSAATVGDVVRALPGAHPPRIHGGWVELARWPSQTPKMSCRVSAKPVGGARRVDFPVIEKRF